MVEGIRQGDIPGVQLRCRQELACSVEEGWRWLRDPRKLERWLCDEARLGEESGAEWLHLAGDGGALDAARERGETVEIETHRRWHLHFERRDQNWRAATDLTFELTPSEGGCELSVLQHGFQRLPLSACLTIWEGYRRRWREALERLAAEVELH